MLLFPSPMNETYDPISNWPPVSYPQSSQRGSDRSCHIAVPIIPCPSTHQRWPNLSIYSVTQVAVIIPINTSPISHCHLDSALLNQGACKLINRRLFSVFSSEWCSRWGGKSPVFLLLKALKGVRAWRAVEEEPVAAPKNAGATGGWIA